MSDEDRRSESELNEKWLLIVKFKEKGPIWTDNNELKSDTTNFFRSFNEAIKEHMSKIRIQQSFPRNINDKIKLKENIKQRENLRKASKDRSEMIKKLLESDTIESIEEQKKIAFKKRAEKLTKLYPSTREKIRKLEDPNSFIRIISESEEEIDKIINKFQELENVEYWQKKKSSPQNHLRIINTFNTIYIIHQTD